jgi:hypothetical protein
VAVRIKRAKIVRNRGDLRHDNGLGTETRVNAAADLPRPPRNCKQLVETGRYSARA